MQSEAVVNWTEAGKSPAPKIADLRGLCRYTTERSPLPTAAAEGLTHLVRYVNPAFCRFIGKEREALLGRPFAEAVPEGEANGCVALLDRVYHTGEAENLAEQEHTHKESGSVYWSYAVWTIFDTQERPTGVMIQITDSTEIALFRREVTLLNQELLLSSVRQHELTEAAEGLNSRLQRAMRETHHRVKNNLQVVSALAEIQLKDGEATVPASAMRRIILHVRTLATLHDILTQQSKTDPGDETLDTQIALHRLLPLLQASIGTRRLHYEVGQMTLTIHKGASLSLLISELVSNAVKHGEGDTAVTLVRNGSEAHLVVRDGGQGFPAGFDPRRVANTGLELIFSLARHDLRGEIVFTNNPEGGGCVLVTFPLQGA